MSEIHNEKKFHKICFSLRCRINSFHAWLSNRNVVDYQTDFYLKALSYRTFYQQQQVSYCCVYVSSSIALLVCRHIVIKHSSSMTTHMSSTHSMNLQLNWHMIKYCVLFTHLLLKKKNRHVHTNRCVYRWWIPFVKQPRELLATSTAYLNLNNV